MKRVEIVTVRACGPERPRSDTASVVGMPDGRLLCAYHSYSASEEAGGDFGAARVYLAESADGGRSWTREGLVVDRDEGDLNVMCPSLCLLGDELLLLYVVNHERAVSSTLLCRSRDGGETFSEPRAVFDRISEHRFCGYDGLLAFPDGMLLAAFQTSASVWDSREHYTVGTVGSNDGGRSWQEGAYRVDLPMRGAMEPSIASLPDGTLVMSLRTQLGAVFVCRSADRGMTWSLPQTTGLRSPESCTCLRNPPGSERLVLFYNDACYEPGHHHYGMRTPLSVAASDDGGKGWRKLFDVAADLEMEYTNLSCRFPEKGDGHGRAILTYLESRNTPGGGFGRTCMSLRAALIPVEMLLPD